MTYIDLTTTSLDPTRRYYFVGIGGIGMSAIAQILLARGIRVAGSDARPFPLQSKLTGAGAEVFIGHDAAHLRQDDVLVLSDAIKPDNPEWRQAVAWVLPIFKRADLLGVLANSGRGIAVTGTHGKTTTSGMLSLILTEAGMNPTCILGGELSALGSNARAGGDITVVEACEAYNSFLNLHPEAAVLTNVEVDHLDFHGTPEHLYDSFRQFLRQVQQVAVLNGDDAMLISMRDLPPRAVTYGQQVEHDYRILDPRVGVESSFVLRHDGADIAEFTLRVPGLYNIYNAAGAATLALEMGADVDAVRRGLAEFPGMHRRFERMGMCSEVAIVDDYAHHPTEIRATLSAARAAFPGTVVALFQPHLFSRTRDLLEEFSLAFGDADIILIAPIYPARELPIPGVSHQQLVERIHAHAPDRPVIALSSLDEGVQLLRHAATNGNGTRHATALPALHRGDVVLTIGAGDVDAVARALVAQP